MSPVYYNKPKIGEVTFIHLLLFPHFPYALWFMLALLQKVG